MIRTKIIRIKVAEAEGLITGSLLRTVCTLGWRPVGWAPLASASGDNKDILLVVGFNYNIFYTYPDIPNHCNCVCCCINAIFVILIYSYTTQKTQVCMWLLQAY